MPWESIVKPWLGIMLNRLNGVNIHEFHINRVLGLIAFAYAPISFRWGA